MPDESPEFLREAEALRDLRVLEEIERNPEVSQRQLANSMGVALGVANACLHALVRKGMIKIRGESNRSISYHLTKKGAGYKGTLALQWTRNTLDFYRVARANLSQRMAKLPALGVERVVLVGVDEQVEIASIVAPETGVQVTAAIRREGTYLGESVSGAPVVGLEDALATTPDAVVLLGQITDAEVASVKDAAEKAGVRFLDLVELA